MIHKRIAFIAALFGVAALGAACDRHDPFSPTAPPPKSALAKTSANDSSSGNGPTKPGAGTPGDTAPHSAPQNPPRPDSTTVPYAGISVIHGQAIVLKPGPAGSRADTLVEQVVAGTAVTLTATATGQTVGTAVAAADGTFSFSVPVGSYRISGHPSAGSGAGDGSIVVNASQPNLYVQLVLPSTP
jgi:hypothetical protein